MATLSVPNTLANGISADGANLEANFTAVESFCNTETLQRDGSIAATAPLTLVAPVSASHAARKQDVDAAVPIGTIHAYAGASAPTNYLLCQGQAESRATYAALFAVLGTAYGAGDGSTTFNMPNLTGRVPVGLNAAGSYATTRGSTGGAADATLPAHTHTGTSDTGNATHQHGFGGTTTGQSASHNHPSLSAGGFLGGTPGGGTSAVSAGSNVNQDASTGAASGDHTHNYSGLTDVQNAAHTHTFTTASSGSSATNANLQPFQAVNWIIKAL